MNTCVRTVTGDRGGGGTHTLDLVAALDRAGGARALAAARDDGRAGDGGGGEREDEGEAGDHRVVAIEESVKRRTKERE